MIDWFAHHAAKLTYANLPLVIGLAGKNNVRPTSDDLEYS